MSAVATQLPLFPEKEPTVTELLCVLLSRVNKWEGTASELCEALHLNAAPRSLVVQLKKAKDELQNAGVYVKYKKLHGRHLINLSTTVNFSQNVTKGVTPIDSTIVKSEFATPTTINYPFSWRYGTVKELNEEEKHESNRRILNGGRKYHYRHCSICGEGGEGVIEYRKESDISTVLLCRECAEDYVRKALRIVERDFQYRFKEDRRIK